MRSVILTSVVLTSLLAPSATVAATVPSRADATHAERAGQPKCLKSAKKVASTKLRTPRGGYFGKAVITVNTEPQGDFSYVVCAYTEVAPRYRNRRNVVRQTFLHFGTSGKLGEIRADTYANKRKPALFGYSLVPAGDKFVFKVKIQAGSKASGKVSFRVPG